jgi:low affinity Fe/Cu permease
MTHGASHGVAPTRIMTTATSSHVQSPTPKAEPSREHRPISELFARLAFHASQAFGTPWTFFAALTLILGWAASGPFFGFSETWQLVINTCTTIITFLMVFLIQATQNRDARAIHLKLDELVRATDARNVFADLEDATEAELDAFQREFAELRKGGMKGQHAMLEARRMAMPVRKGKEPR